MQAHQEITPEIFIIEDDPGIRDALTSLLRFMNVEAAWAESGKEALSKTRHFVAPPKLVIIDGKLPDTHGQELSQLLRTLVPEDTAFYLFSAEVNAQSCEDKPKHWDGFISKPFEISDFIEVVKKHCGSV